MGIHQSLALLLVICCSLCPCLADSTGPDDRPLTDPKSVVSSSHSGSRPAPIDDLYYTKSVFGAASNEYRQISKIQFKKYPFNGAPDMPAIDKFN